MPYILKNKHERITKVPDEVVVNVFMTRYIHLKDRMSPDRLANDPQEKERFRHLLSRVDSVYAGVPLLELGAQIIDLRKKGKISLRTNRKGPAIGYKELKFLDCLKSVMSDQGFDCPTIRSVTEAVESLYKKGV